MAFSSAIATRLSHVIRRLSSESEGEIIAAMHALLRLLESCGSDIHVLAACVENGGGLSEADKQKIKGEIENAHAIGYAEGVKAAEAKQHGTGHSATSMASSSGPRSRCLWSVRSIGFPTGATNSSTIWPPAQSMAANQL